MTQRSILAGTQPTVVIKAGGSVTVKGQDSDLVTAETKGRLGADAQTAQRGTARPCPGGDWRARLVRYSFEKARYHRKKPG